MGAVYKNGGDIYTIVFEGDHGEERRQRFFEDYCRADCNAAHTKAHTKQGTKEGTHEGTIEGTDARNGNATAT